MITFEVDKPFQFEIRDRVFFDFKENGFHLPIGLRNITPEEIDSFKNGKINMDIAFINNIIFIVFEIEGILNLSDVPFHIALSTAPLENLELKDGEVYGLYMFLIDSKDNTLKAMRLISLSEEFSHTLKSLIDKQLEEYFNMGDYQRKLIEVYSNMSPQDLKEMSLAHFSIDY